MFSAFHQIFDLVAAEAQNM